MTRIDVIFGFKIVNDMIDLLSTSNFHVPRRSLRHNCYFYNNEYHWLSPTERISDIININSSSLDLYNSSLYNISKSSKSLFNYN